MVKKKQRLAATIDGKPLPDDEVRALWTRFSEYMEKTHGDSAGFARESGYVSVTPTYRSGQAVLLILGKRA